MQLQVAWRVTAQIGFKIRQHSIARVPFILICGDREIETQTISVRTWQGNDLGTMAVESFHQRHRAQTSDPMPQ